MSSIRCFSRKSKGFHGVSSCVSVDCVSGSGKGITCCVAIGRLGLPSYWSQASLAASLIAVSCFALKLLLPFPASVRATMAAGSGAALAPDVANAPGGVDESDSDGSSTTSAPLAMSEVEGSSSASEDEPAVTSKRGQVGQFVWPCPREYPSALEERKKRKHLIPEDVDKPAAGALFRKALAKSNQDGNLLRLHVFDEPHKRYHKNGQRRARHKHFLFKMRNTFAFVHTLAV